MNNSKFYVVADSYDMLAISIHKTAADAYKSNPTKRWIMEVTEAVKVGAKVKNGRLVHLSEIDIDD